MVIRLWCLESHLQIQSTSNGKAMQFTFVCRLTRKLVGPLAPCARTRIKIRSLLFTVWTCSIGITGSTSTPAQPAQPAHRPTGSTDLATADQQHKLHRIPIFENSL